MSSNCRERVSRELSVIVGTFMQGFGQKEVLEQLNQAEVAALAEVVVGMINLKRALLRTDLGVVKKRGRGRPRKSVK